MVHGGGGGSLDTAIRLVTQAVHQDTAKNYDEAARCYRESVAVFRAVARSKGVSKKVQRAIDEKCKLYEARLKKLDRHQLAQADLSKLFRDVCKRPASVASTNSSSSSKHSDDSIELYENPYLKSGLDTVRRAKKEDTRSHLPEAVHFYELGAGLLLDSVRRGQVPEAQIDVVRIKCLLIHDRCELIKNHLEFGAPLVVRKQALDSLEHSLEGGSPPPGSPEQLFEEEQQLMMMEEVQSNVSGSTHSLYPAVVCVETKRSISVVSGQSDYAVLNSSTPALATTAEEVERLIPLADLDMELKLSALSVGSGRSSGQSSATTPRRRISNSCSVDNLDKISSGSSGSRAGSRVSRLLASDMDGILVLNSSGQLSDVSVSIEELDRNVSEISYVNARMIEVSVEHTMMQGRRSNSNDSGSDSGFSDPSHETAKTPTSFVGGEANMMSKSPLSDIDSLNIVPSLPVETTSPSPARSRASMRSSRKSSGSSRMVEDEVTVLSEETVIDGLLVQPSKNKKPSSRRVIIEHEVYAKAADPSVRPREEYIPPRALARRDRMDGEEEDSQGCYYFMACLDSFWIL